MKNQLNHKIGMFFQKISRWFFDRTLMACWYCGALVGMNSTFAKGHMWCEHCYQRYAAPYRNVVARQNKSVVATRPVPCTCGMDDGMHEWDCAISRARRDA